MANSILRITDICATAKIPSESTLEVLLGILGLYLPRDAIVQSLQDGDQVIIKLFLTNDGLEIKTSSGGFMQYE